MQNMLLLVPNFSLFGHMVWLYLVSYDFRDSKQLSFNLQRMNPNKDSYWY